MADVSWLFEDQGIGFGLATHPGVSAGDLVDLAVRAEELGYGSIWATEDVGREVFGMLGAIAARTTRVRVGTGIVGVFARSAPLTAQAVATIDELSGRRAFLGLGIGALRLASGWHMGEPHRLARRLEEYVDLVRAVLGGTDEFAGTVLQARNARLSFPVRADVPILVAALNERTLAVVERTADGWMPTVAPLTFVEETRARLPTGMPIAMYTVCAAAEDRNEARELARAMVGYYLGAIPGLRSMAVRWLGWDREEEFLQLWNEGSRDEATATVDDRILDELSICGSPDECRRSLERFRASRVYVVVGLPSQAPKHVIEGTLAALAPDRTGRT